MIIMLEGALPCAQVERRQPSARQPSLCRQSANVGIITLVDDGIWELLPVCQQHFQEAALDWGERDAHPLQSWIHAQGPTEQVGI